MVWLPQNSCENIKHPLSSNYVKIESARILVWLPQNSGEKKKHNLS